MVKLLNLSVAAAALLTPIAEARDCTTGLRYCGYVLLKVGNYDAQIRQALSDGGHPINDDWIKYSYFDCIGGYGGLIKWLDKCKGCVDSPEGNSDVCLKN
ncbi:hypothetical protein NW752_001365 [Fusarium irregulare]|uniref:Uncharacterized protein n=1 Tax=Fusarium irregulare TaxID=2494466 RepID=A0A9W8U5T3_9HYPO|nr:hypothetical protein NW766_010944 [Fusarium irregulare]KAJ4026422.1 hypothetical protein NW752_001365 [Fusarium irregulare]